MEPAPIKPPKKLPTKHRVPTHLDAPPRQTIPQKEFRPNLLKRIWSKLRDKAVEIAEAEATNIAKRLLKKLAKRIAK